MKEREREKRKRVRIKARAHEKTHVWIPFYPAMYLYCDKKEHYDNCNNNNKLPRKKVCLEPVIYQVKK